MNLKFKFKLFKNYEPWQVIKLANQFSYWRVNLKEAEHMIKYLKLVRELKKLWNMKYSNHCRDPWNNNRELGKEIRSYNKMDYWVKMKESEKWDKYLDFGWELKNLRNTKVTVI